MAFLTEEMKQQLMKVVGMSDTAEFDNLVKQHAPQIKDFGETLNRHSPFDLQQVLMKEQVEASGINKYTELRTLEEKVGYVYTLLSKDPEFKDIKKMIPTRKKSVKDPEKSKRSRDLGNKNFQKKVNEEAIRYYNESILFGPIDNGRGKEVALGLGNRSVVFFQLCEYDCCLDDIEGALAFGYPIELQYKIFERKGKCLEALGNIAEAKICYEKALETVDIAKATEEKKAEIKADMNTAIKTLLEGSDNNPVALLTKDKFKIWTPSKQFPSMSESVSIVYSPEVGRHGVASTNIRPGELILIETPLAWTVNLNMFSTVCQQCIMQVGRTPFPSPTHDTGIFCSYKCLTEYQDLYGLYDDLGLMELFGVASGEAANSVMLAFRSLIRNPAEFYIQNQKDLFTNYDQKYGTNNSDNWKLEGENNVYQAIFNLVNHREEMSLDKEIETVIKSVVILRFLLCSGYFGKLTDTNITTLTPEVSFIGKLIFLFTCGINYNQHGIYEARGAIEAGKKLPLIDIGSAFYPNMVLLNHSCCPNTLRINQGKKSYLVAKHLIKAGEEVTDCYGMHHLTNQRDERLPILKKGFLFQCKCQACQDNWQPLHQLESRLSPGEMGKLGTLLSKYQSNFRELKFSAASQFCVEYLEKLAEMKIMMPHRNYEIASLALSSCFWAILQ